MGANLNWFTECGAPDHHNACVKTFEWYFLEYVSKSLKIESSPPFVPLPPTCPGYIQVGPTAEQNKCIVQAESEIMRLERVCMGRKTQNNTPLCIWQQKRDFCRTKGDLKAQEFTQSCGYPVSIIRTMEMPSFECESCGQKLMDEIVQRTLS